MAVPKHKDEGNLYSRFILRVLAPPFIAMLLVSIIALQQLGTILHRQAIDGLKRSAVATAATLEREFSLRETVLKQTGAELFVIKNEYTTNRQKLDSSRDACRAHIKQNLPYTSAPNGACEPFSGGFEAGRATLLALENEYVKLGEASIQDQNQRTNERLSAFKQFFPETLVILVLDEKKQVVSSAHSGAFKGSNEIFQPEAAAAQASPIRGKVMSAADFKLVTFAFQIPGGSVLAAYDLQNEHFIRQVWLSAPIDRSRASVVLLDASGTSVYPVFKISDVFKKNIAALRDKPFAEMQLDNVAHTVVAAPAGSSNWLVAVASPTAAVLSPLRDARLIGGIFLGLFIVGFLWVGTFFVRRTLRNIVKLVSGANVFGSGKLDYKIKLDRHADGEFVSLADTMNTMADRIAAAELAIDKKNKEFISIATHEMRSPLTAIIANLTLFRGVHEKKLDQKAQHTIDQAYFSTVRLRDLINDMLDVAHLESGQAISKLTSVPVKPMIEDILSAMGDVANAAQINMVYLDAHSALVVADEKCLRIIINNFISNAIKYNRPGGHIEVSHELKGGKLVTMIKDDGLGIPQDQQAHMFEKFFRVQHEDRQGVAGTGLGLYIVKQYIEQMNGEIWFESVHGKSTKFCFSLPIAKS